MHEQRRGSGFECRLVLDKSSYQQDELNSQHAKSDTHPTGGRPNLCIPMFAHFDLNIFPMCLVRSMQCKLFFLVLFASQFACNHITYLTCTVHFFVWKRLNWDKLEKMKPEIIISLFFCILFSFFSPKIDFKSFYRVNRKFTMMLDHNFRKICPFIYRKLAMLPCITHIISDIGLNQIN